MPDRESVIRGLESVILLGRYDAAAKLVARDALALLREMEPVEPIKKPGIVEPYKCGACGAVLGWESEKQRFCPKCGRGIKWNA